jgi:cytochrome c peroxidase
VRKAAAEFRWADLLNRARGHAAPVRLVILEEKPMPLRRRATTWCFALLVVLVTACDAPTHPRRAPIGIETPVAAVEKAAFSELEELGLFIFNDQELSLRQNQACSTCHDKFWGFTSPNTAINARGAVMPGSTGLFGSRKTPSVAYVSQAPVRFFDPGEGFVGGNFWDGRATGARLGSPAAEQALLPFLSQVEMALPDRACVLFRIKQSFYGLSFINVFGPRLSLIRFPQNTDQLCRQAGATVPLSTADRNRVLAEYDNVGRAVLAFESSSAVNQFSSKHDAVLDGLASFTAQEQRGLTLFRGKANCATCHPNVGRKALFTKYTYDNIGVSRNSFNPAFVANPSFRDFGLGGVVGNTNFNGMQKIPTLRNVDRRGPGGGTKAYMHNGAFKTLEQVVHFYNTRDVLPRCNTVSSPSFGVNCWRPPEVSQNVNSDDLGNLRLTLAEERAIVAYLKTLTDGFYKPGF